VLTNDGARVPADPVILCADDDPDDRLLLRDAARACGLGTVVFVEDGEEALAYLRGEGRFADRDSAPVPSIVLLDLNMPRKDGREALREIRADARLRQIPVVVLTTSSAPTDIDGMYAIGASSYVVKPLSFDGLIGVLRDVAHYWFETVRLPARATP
jgi:CheY-like chemotaxis protein